MLVETPPELQTIPFVHIVTLIHRFTGHEVAIEVVTATERFADVMCQICQQKVERRLQGYEVFEFLPISGPVPF